MKWSVAIFSSREALGTLTSSVRAILGAASSAATTIDVIVNGNQILANKTGSYVEGLHPARKARTLIRVWYVSLSDKAHAWNQYVHSIWPVSDIAYFVDGYVEVMPNALALISDGLVASPDALAASGVPTMGRSSKMLRALMLREGGIHGNLYAVRGKVLARLRVAGFRLPLGIYRTDSLLGAVMCFGLDPAKNDWNTSRVLVHPHATWAFRPLNWQSTTDIRSHTQRVMRQAQGILENLAVREHLAIQRRAPQSLPRTSSELVGAWIDAFPMSAMRIFIAKPLCLLAARRLRRHRDWSQSTVPPLLITQADI